MPGSRIAVVSVLALSLGGCSFLGGSESDASASAPLTETSTTSVTDTASPTDSTTDTASENTSTSGSETGSEPPSQTSTLADPNEPSATSGSTLANPTASGSDAAGSLPLTVRGDKTVTRSVGLPSGAQGLAFRATCGTAGQIVVKLTFNGSGGSTSQSLRAGPCTASQPLMVQSDAVPSGATKVTVQATTDPAGEFWLVVLKGQ